MRLYWFCFAAIVCSEVAGSQVAAPVHQSGAQHVRQSRAQNYSQRFEALKCAIVEIVRGIPNVGTEYGTGFYISPNGDIATASHVVGDRVWTSKPEGGVTVDLILQDQLTIIDINGSSYSVPKTSIEENREAWGADVAHIATGRKTSCWIATAPENAKVRTGDLVITLGFPGLAFGSLTMYEGIVSAPSITSDLPVGQTTTGADVQATNKFLRVQMPISGGLSGAPVLNDENKAIAVVTNAGLWGGQPMDHLIQMFDTRQLGPPLVQPPFVQQRDTLNLSWVIGVLAKSIHQYSSPGYGDCVPLSYLKMNKEKSNQTSSQLGH